MLYIAGPTEHLSQRELLARFHWLCGRLADYQKEPAAAVQELQACLTLCRGKGADSAEAAHHPEGVAETAAEGLEAAPEAPEVRLKLASCRHDGEVSARTTAAKLEALRVSSASAEGLGRLQVRPSAEIQIGPKRRIPNIEKFQVFGVVWSQCGF